MTRRRTKLQHSLQGVPAYLMVSALSIGLKSVSTNFTLVYVLVTMFGIDRTTGRNSAYPSIEFSLIAILLVLGIKSACRPTD